MNSSRCTLSVRGLDCPNEVAILRAALDGIPGVRQLGFDLIHGMMTVDYSEAETNPQQVLRLVRERTRMQADLVAPTMETAAVPPSWWSRHGRWASTLGSGLALAAGTIAGWLIPAVAPGVAGAGAARLSQACFALSVVLGGVWLYPRAIRSLRRFRLDIDVLMGLAILGAIGLGQWDEAATVAFLFGLAEVLESFSLERARRAIRTSLEIAPRHAERIEADGTLSQVPASEVQAGDRLLIRAGDTMPVDGTILRGRSSVDQKTITGESVPVDRGPDDPVYAGTVNGEGTLEIRAAGPVSTALISRIVAQVREAQSGRAPVERRISRFAAVYTPAVVVLSLLVMLVPPLLAWAGGAGAAWADWHDWFYRGLVILVIACPCALVIATPVAVVCGLAAAARGGVLVKGGEYLEEVGRLRALAFDKTGTLTLGRPDVVEVVCAPGQDDENQVLRIAAALGDRGGHVLGKAIARHARDMRLDVPMADDYRAIPGLGALGRVDTVEYHLGSHRYIDEAGLCHPVFHDEMGKAESTVGTAVALTAQSGPLGWIRLADRPRPEASRVLAELHALGLQTIMLTGDNARTAAAMARQLGVGEQRAELLPADKVTAISDLSARHGPTGMVGDGVNDAPALAAARVSLALGGISSGAAIETADIVLMADDLDRLPWLIRHSRATLARISQNIALALLTKAAVLVLAILGLANLWMAIAADVGTSLLVIANALRLLGGTPEPVTDPGPGASIGRLDPACEAGSRAAPPA